MIIYNFDKVIRVKLLLTAGAANKNIQLRTIFNNYRSMFYDSFCEDFNTRTQHLPNDILIATVVYIPLPGSNVSECRFEVKGPSLYNLFKKFNFLNVFYKTGLLYFKISILELYKLAVLKQSLSVAHHSLALPQLFSMFMNSFYSYSISKKNLLFVIKYFAGAKNTFYSIQFFPRFYKTFFKS